MYRKFETELAGRKLTVETGRVAELANGDAIIHYGDTVVMVNVTASKEPREGIDFFPLSVCSWKDSRKFPKKRRKASRQGYFNIKSYR